MSMNPCLQPACLSDVPHTYEWHPGQIIPGSPGSYRAIKVQVENQALRALYDAEWKKRGFDRSP